MPIRRRILLCRLGFMLLCVLPTLAVGIWGVSRSASGIGRPSKDQWQLELASHLGLVVEIGGVHYPQAGVAMLEFVTLRDPETRALVAQVRSLEIERSAGGWLVVAAQVQLDAPQLALLHETLDHRVLRSSADDAALSSPIHLTLRDVTLVSSRGRQSLRQLEGTLLHDETGVSLRLGWQLPEGAFAESPGQFMVLRNRAASPPETVWHLDTAGQSVPCNLLADWVPQLARLGTDCKFTGSLQWTDTAAGPRGSLRGKFHDMDLDALVTEHFPHQLSGVARLDITRADLEAGKLTALVGTLESQDGAISLSLLKAMRDHLQLELLIDRHSLDASRPILFELLAAKFNLDGHALVLSGINSEVLLFTAAEEPMVAVPQQHTVAPVSLLRALLPENQLQVPATRQTATLIGLLPVPDIVPARTATLPSHTPTRLRPSGPSEAAPVLRQPKLR